MLSDSDIRERLGPLTDPSSTPDQDPRRKGIGLVAAVVVFVVALWVGGIALIGHLEGISPKVAEPSSGHVYAFSDTRHKVYLTQNEEHMAWAALGVPLVATLGAVFMVLWRKFEPN
jgi:hypothetical protein